MKSIAMFRNVIVLAALGASAGLALAAGSKTTTVGVSASVESNCLVYAPSKGLEFGIYDPFAGADYNAATSFKVRCSKNALYTIALNAGTGPSATLSDRKMVNGSQTAMSYAIYSDSARTVNWGATALAGAATGYGSGLGTDNTVDIYATIPTGQLDVGVGAYADTVIATISY